MTRDNKTSNYAGEYCTSLYVFDIISRSRSDEERIDYNVYIDYTFSVCILILVLGLGQPKKELILMCI